MVSKLSAQKALLLAPSLMLACTLSLLQSPFGDGQLPATSPPTQRAVEASAAVAPSPTAASFDPSATATPFCEDARPLSVLESFDRAVRTRDGALLASIVSPERGMDARLLRDGRVVNYDAVHAAALFDSTFEVEWGHAPGSGLPIKGSFGELFVPDLLDVFSRPYTTTCNQIRLGGSSYLARWPYAPADFYSIYYSGSPASGNLDWHTWAVGIEILDGSAYTYAITQFKWEP